MATRRACRGRPEAQFAENPQQWELAFVERGIRAFVMEGNSPLQAISAYVTWQAVLRGVARTVHHQDDNLEAHRRGRLGDWVTMTKLSPKLLATLKAKHEKDYDWDWHTENAFRPEIRSVEKKLSRIRKNDPDRLQVMVDICELYLSGKIREARQLATSIREAENFEGELRRILGWVTVRFGHPFGQTLRHTITY
jgi:hypothetical protein